jgi:type III secretion system FlhB-like substrate exporter
MENLNIMEFIESYPRQLYKHHNEIYTLLDKLSNQLKMLLDLNYLVSILKNRSLIDFFLKIAINSFILVFSTSVILIIIVQLSHKVIISIYYF